MEKPRPVVVDTDFLQVCCGVGVVGTCFMSSMWETTAQSLTTSAMIHISALAKGAVCAYPVPGWMRQWVGSFCRQSTVMQSKLRWQRPSRWSNGGKISANHCLWE